MRIRKRSCTICKCELYEDERGSYCQDCRTICERIGDENEKPRWADNPDRQARLQIHAERIEAMVANLSAS